MNKKQDAEKLIKDFFEFIFGDKVSIYENETYDEVYDIYFHNPIVKKVVISNLPHIKTCLNLYFAFSKLDIGKFRLNILDQDKNDNF